MGKNEKNGEKSIKENSSHFLWNQREKDTVSLLIQKFSFEKQQKRREKSISAGINEKNIFYYIYLFF
jgi:hypothetical protein